MKTISKTPSKAPRRVALVAVAGAALVLLALGGCDSPRETSADSRLEHVDQSNFNDRVLKSTAPVLVDFYADWCPGCVAFLPTLEAFAQERPDARIVKINVDRSGPLAARYGIRSIPHLIVFKNGKAAVEHSGPANMRELTALMAD
jgi:thioredoxin 1